MAIPYEQMTEEERRQRRELERLSLLSPFTRFKERIGGMFDETPSIEAGTQPIPLDDWWANPVNKFSGLLDIRKFDTSPNIASEGAFGSTYNPGTFAKPGLYVPLGDTTPVPFDEGTITYNAQGIPTYSLPTVQQKIPFNPNYGVGSGVVRDDKVGFADLKEYDVGGTLDRNLAGLGGQDTIYGELTLGDLNAQGQEKLNKGQEAVKEYKKNNKASPNPFSDKNVKYQEGLNKIGDKYAFGLNDLTKDGLKKFNVVIDADTGGFRNIGFGGGYVPGGTPSPNLKGRAFPGGDTLGETVTNAGMILSGDGQVGRQSAQSLQYTGENVIQSNPMIRNTRSAISGGIILDPEVSKMFIPGGQYGAKLAGTDTIGETAKSATDIMPILGNALMIYGLLNQPIQQPAGTPQGARGTNIAQQNLYDRERYKYGLL